MTGRWKKVNVGDWNGCIGLVTAKKVSQGTRSTGVEGAAWGCGALLGGEEMWKERVSGLKRVDVRRDIRKQIME